MLTGKWIAIRDFFKFLIAVGQGFDVIKDAWTLYICLLCYLRMIVN
ncbi:MAG: hypothetical protein KDK55_03370 [Chlamydiia bacterium]|nr:hypothetical protein [Chlamydiia bacterium]